MSVAATKPADEISSIPLRVVIVGHVDHGKSTMVGRLLHDTDSLPDGKFESVQAMCEKRGVPFEWAFVMDAMQAERDQNITIDTAQIWFHSDERQYVIIDAPGHKEFLKNMITGAASADAALLLIAANEGVQEQSRRHGYMLSLLGIRQVAVMVNKMDMVGYDESVFRKIEKEYRIFLSKIGIEPQVFIPISSREGDNIASTASKTMTWYDGQTVVGALDGFDMPEIPENQPLRFPVQDVYRFDERRIIAGRIESGSLKVGDMVHFAPHDKASRVASVERWNAEQTDNAGAGESVGITLEEQIFVERGHVGHHRTHGPLIASRLRANLFWMGKNDLEVGRKVKIKLATQEADASVVRIISIIDASTLDALNEPGAHISRNDVAEVVIETRSPLAFDTHQDLEITGRFVLVDGYDVAGGGIVIDALAEESVRRSRYEHLHTPVSAAERRAKKGHRGAVLYIADPDNERLKRITSMLERELFAHRKHTLNLSREFALRFRDVEDNRDHAYHTTAAILAEAGTITLVNGPGNGAFVEWQRQRAREREFRFFAVQCAKGRAALESLAAGDAHADGTATATASGENYQLGKEPISLAGDVFTVDLNLVSEEEAAASLAQRLLPEFSLSLDVGVGGFI